MASSHVPKSGPDPLGPFRYFRTISTPSSGQYRPVSSATLEFNNIDLDGKTTRAWVEEANVSVGWYVTKTEENGTQFEARIITSITYATNAFTVVVSTGFNLGYTPKMFDFLAP